MARRHGWGGSPPANEQEARARIVEAAMRCVDRKSPAEFTIQDVASELGVIRQTVYRYYAGTDELFVAVGRASVVFFLDEHVEHLRGFTRPADWVVEALASAIEWLPSRPHLTLLLSAGHTGRFTRDITSTASMGFGRQLFERSPIDWAAAGYDEQRRDELIELMLRILQSMVVDPGHPPRAGLQLREYLRRWIAPAITSE